MLTFDRKAVPDSPAFWVPLLKVFRTSSNVLLKPSDRKDSPNTLPVKPLPGALALVTTVTVPVLVLL